MKTLVVEASPRREGNSITLARSLIQGLRDASETEVVELFLNDMEIRHCIGCWSCLKLGKPGCVIDDDMMRVYPLLMEADLLVFATPIYWWTICGQMKTFMDRLEGLLNGNGPNNLSGKALVLILTYVAEDPDGVYLAIRMYRSIAAWAGMTLHVVKYNSISHHVKESPGKLEETYSLGRSLAGHETPELTVPCPIQGCKGMFVSDEALARHLAAGAGPTHREWRRLNGFRDLGLADDDHWKDILRRIRAGVRPPS